MRICSRRERLVHGYSLALGGHLTLIPTHWQGDCMMWKDDEEKRLVQQAIASLYRLHRKYPAYRAFHYNLLHSTIRRTLLQSHPAFTSRAIALGPSSPLRTYVRLSGSTSRSLAHIPIRLNHRPETLSASIASHRIYKVLIIG